MQMQNLKHINLLFITDKYILGKANIIAKDKISATNNIP